MTGVLSRLIPKQAKLSGLRQLSNVLKIHRNLNRMNRRLNLMRGTKMATTAESGASLATGDIPEETREKLASRSRPVEAMVDPKDLADMDKKAARIEKRGAKSDEEQQIVDAAGLKPFVRQILLGCNALVKDRVPEFEHSTQEIDAISHHASLVLAKYLPSFSEEYEHEIALAILVGSSVMEKGMLYVRNHRGSSSTITNGEQKAQTGNTQG